MTAAWTFLPLLVAFLLGSIPFAFLAGKVKGVDLRRHGSGNVGATNALRVLGTPTGVAVLLLDAGKGALAVLIAAAVAHRGVCPASLFPMVGGFAAVLGHVFSPFMAFKGGKGVATAAGVFLALSPVALAIAFAVFAAVVATTRYVSAGSIMAALALPFLVWWRQGVHPNLGLATLLALLVVIRHRSNVDRILQGTESPIRFTRHGAAPAVAAAGSTEDPAQSPGAETEGAADRKSAIDVGSRDGASEKEGDHE